MKPAAPEPLALDYSAIAALAETIAQKTGIRTLPDFSPLVQGMGGSIARVPPSRWAAPDALSLLVRGPRDFVVYLAESPSLVERLLLATAIGQYFLHAQEGRRPSGFPRFAKTQTSLEGLWFGMSIVIPDAPFALAESRQELDDETVARLFGVPTALIALKRKLLDSERARQRAVRAAPASEAAA